MQTATGPTPVSRSSLNGAAVRLSQADRLISDQIHWTELWKIVGWRVERKTLFCANGRALKGGEKAVWDERRRRLLDKETGNHLDRRNLWQDPGAFIGAAVLLRHQVETDLPLLVMTWPPAIVMATAEVPT